MIKIDSGLLRLLACVPVVITADIQARQIQFDILASENNVWHSRQIPVPGLADTLVVFYVYFGFFF